MSGLPFSWKQGQGKNYMSNKSAHGRHFQVKQSVRSAIVKSVLERLSSEQKKDNKSQEEIQLEKKMITWKKHKMEQFKQKYGDEYEPGYGCGFDLGGKFK